jgi:cytoskeletal protein CcmA (bactofilin family)
MIKKNNKISGADMNSPEKLNRLVEGTVITGNMLSEGNIRIDGEVKGNISTKGKLVVGVNGVVLGDIDCEFADVEGKITGNLRVKQSLTLKSTAVVKGDILYGKLIIDGATFIGNSNVIGASNANKSALSKESVVA